jgi:integrase
VELSDGTRVVSSPKTAAGTRTVSIPQAVVPDLEHHLAHFAGNGPDGLVFCGEKGRSLRRQVWNRKWREAVASVGPAGLHFHDLRHTGNTLAAGTGASTKELMARMGHASPRAALIYQHATAEREDTIARALSDLISTSVPEPRVPVVEFPAPPDR